MCTLIWLSLPSSRTSPFFNSAGSPARTTEIMSYTTVLTVLWSLWRHDCRDACISSECVGYICKVNARDVPPNSDNMHGSLRSLPMRCPCHTAAMMRLGHADLKYVPSFSFLPFSTVPFELPTSVTVHLLPSQCSSACLSETALSLMWKSLARVRPTVSRSPLFERVVPRHGPLTASSDSTADSAGSPLCEGGKAAALAFVWEM